MGPLSAPVGPRSHVEDLGPASESESQGRKGCSGVVVSPGRGNRCANSLLLGAGTETEPGSDRGITKRSGPVAGRRGQRRLSKRLHLGTIVKLGPDLDRGNGIRTIEKRLRYEKVPGLPIRNGPEVNDGAGTVCFVGPGGWKSAGPELGFCFPTLIGSCLCCGDGSFAKAIRRIVFGVVGTIKGSASRGRASAARGGAGF